MSAISPLRQYVLYALVAAAVAASSVGRLAGQQTAPSAVADVVETLEPPAHPLPPEAASAGQTRFSFIAYGDTRGDGTTDGREVQPDHAKLVEGMLAAMKREAANGFPVKFVVQSGDAVVQGRLPRMWNVSFIPIIKRLIGDGDVPYYFAVGNHDVGGTPVDRELGLRNAERAMQKLWPPEGSPRRLDGYPTFAFGYGHVFVIALDSNIPEDGTQYAWVEHQLEGLDRTRFTQIVAVFHHPPISSGPHGGASLERQAAGIRRIYLPLFRKHHVRLTIAGHEHFFEHWVEHYRDGNDTYRMDHIVEGGGGAPTYVFNATPDAGLFEAMAAPQHVEVKPLAQPGWTVADNPHSFVILEFDGDRIWLRVVAEGGAPYAPYGTDRIELSEDTSPLP